jgi:5-hydroxyisourate hydrolase-like protein (transthyretin family)
MLQRTRAVIVAVAMGAGAFALAPSATAAAGTSADPVVSNVEIAPNPVVVTGSPVTAKFSFTTTAAGKAEFQIKAPGVGVWTSLDLKPSPHGTETKWTASKTFDAKSTAGQWSFLAIAHSGDGKEDSARGKFAVDVRKSVDTKIVDFDASPDAVAKGAGIEVSGKLLRDSGGWSGYGGQSVTITFREKGTDAYRHVAKVGTGRSGWFKARVKADATGWWRAEFAGNGGARASVSDTDRVDVKVAPKVVDSRIVDFDARPDRVEEGDRLGLRGRLQLDTRHGWDGYAGKKVVILFRADGSSRWDDVARDWTDRDGRFGADVTARRSGHWRAVFAGNDDVRGSSSGSDHVTVVRPQPEPDRSASRVVKFNASPEPGRYGRYLKFTGKLQVDDSSGWEGYRGKVALYFKAKGSHKWSYVKTTRSNGSGNLYTKAKTYKSGYWKFVFKGDGDFYGDSSRSDYVRVVRR